MLIVMAGLPGSGKTSLSRMLAEHLTCPLVSVDVIEAAIWRSGIPRSELTGLASYVVTEALAREQLSLGNDVIVDAVNDAEQARTQWHALARSSGHTLRFIEAYCSDEHEHRRRVQSRRRDRDGLPEITWEDIEPRRQGLSAWHDRRFRVDTAQPAETNITAILAHIVDESPWVSFRSSSKDREAGVISQDIGDSSASGHR